MYTVRRFAVIVGIFCIVSLAYVLLAFNRFEKQYAKHGAKSFAKHSQAKGVAGEAQLQSVATVRTPSLLHLQVKKILEGILVTPNGVENDGKRQQILEEYDKHIQPGILSQNPWRLAETWVHPTMHIVPPNAPELGGVLEKLSTSPITKTDVSAKGTQLKLVLTLEGGQRVLFKPMFYSREHINEGASYGGADRHNGEIAAFHIGRLLGFNRTPLVAGRRLSVQEIRAKSTPTLRNTFYKQGDEWCFYGECRYCNENNGVCGQSDTLEGAVVLMLPDEYVLQPHRSPWQQTYRKHVYANWETDAQYCKKLQLKTKSPRSRILDFIDNSILDFLIQNADRHHVETFRGYPGSILLLLDNGKSFGNPGTHDFSILAPLYQCCMLRRSTYSQLLIFLDHLGESVDRVTRYDPLYPLLTAEHLAALDTRLRLILAAVIHCRNQKELQLVDDS